MFGHIPIFTNDARKYFMRYPEFKLTSSPMDRKVIKKTDSIFSDHEIDDYKLILEADQRTVKLVLHEASYGYTYGSFFSSSHAPGCEQIFDPKMVPTIALALKEFWGDSMPPERLEDAFKANEEAFVRCLVSVAQHLYDPDYTAYFKKGQTWTSILDAFSEAVPNLAEYQQCSLGFKNDDGGTTLILYALGKPIRKLRVVGIATHPATTSGTVFSYINGLREAVA